MSPTTTPVADWGQIVVETDVDREVIAPLMLWMPTYLRQLERERDLDPYLLARPRLESYHNSLEDLSFPDARLPAIVVTTAQIEGEPEPTIAGLDDAYTAEFLVRVSAVVRGRTPPETRELAALYSGCARRILVNQGTALGKARWLGSLVTPLPDTTDTGRYLAAGVTRWSVMVDEVQSGDGPVIPEPIDPQYPPPDPEGNPDEPYDPLAEVRAVTTQIVARS
jgi:hypothetical protein